MAFEIPTDLLSKTKILIRKAAKVSSYYSDDPSLFELPSLEETIAQLNPSPPYLRCKHCKGRLLRDLESIICIFCGESQITGVHPEPISFRNTVGCRWLLESLELNGSEMAGPYIDVKEAKRGEPVNEVPLSNLLNIEIKWSPKSEKVETSASNESKVQSKGPLNFAGVDLDNFFSEEKEDKTSVLAEEQSTINKLINENDNDTVQPNEQLHLFEDFKPPEINKSSEPKSRDSFSGWEASFQSARSSIHDKEKISIDPFAALQMDVVFGPQEGSTGGESKENETLSSSMSDDWFQNDLWNKPSSTHHEQVDVIAKAGDKNLTEEENRNNFMSSSVDWDKEDNWPTRSQQPDNKAAAADDDSFDAWNDFTSSTSTANPVNSSWNQAFEDPVPSVKERSEQPDNKAAADYEDSFDAWNDFTSSTSTANPGNSSLNQAFEDPVPSVKERSEQPDNKAAANDEDSFDAWDDFTSSTSTANPVNSSWNQAFEDPVPSVKERSEIDFSSVTTINDVDFSNPLHPGVVSHQNGSTGVEPLQLETSLYRSGKEVGTSEDTAKCSDISVGDNINVAKSNSDDVQRLLAQMHDLSFMLENNLSIPPK